MSWMDAVLFECTRVTWQGWIVDLIGGCGLGWLVYYIVVRPTREVKAPVPGDGHHAIRTIAKSVHSRGRVGGWLRLEHSPVRSW
jgi:hypothetical protein